MRFSCLDMSNAVFCIVWDKDLFETIVIYKKLLWIKYEFISAISSLSWKCQMY